MELADDAYSILAAAADTAGNTMTIIAFNVMSNPKIYENLRKELFQTYPDADAKLEFQKLEKLPYLTAVIKEGLRLAFGVAGRLPRLVPEPGATFNGYFVPAGMIVSMSAWTQHHDEDLFPNSDKFDPNRWLNRADAMRLDKNLFAFGKGNRGCIGMPLAYCELYLVIGTFFHRFKDLKPYLTTKEDLILDDFFSTYHVAGKNWLKATGPAE